MSFDLGKLINTTLDQIKKKWSIEIILELIEARTSFTELMRISPNLSGKMLSGRLKELVEDGIIEKVIVSQIILVPGVQASTVD